MKKAIRRRKTNKYIKKSYVNPKKLIYIADIDKLYSYTLKLDGNFHHFWLLFCV